MSRFGIPGSNVDPLAYADTRLSVVPAVQAARRPLTSDNTYPVWTEWRVTKDPTTGTEGEFWKLIKYTGPKNAIWVMVGSFSGSGILTLTGDTGGAVGPDAFANVDTLGGTGVSVAGNPGTNTLTWSVDGSVATTYSEDTGSATPSLNILNVSGGNLLSTTGAGNTITVDADPSVAAAFAADSGTGTPAANSITVSGGTGVTTSAAGSVVTIGVDGTVATTYTEDTGSATPALNNLNILGGTGLSTTGAGSTVTVDADATVPLSFPTDSGTAVPALNALTVAGGTNISTSGSGSTVTINYTGGVGAGIVIQEQRSTNSAVVAVTSVIPYDNTIPQKSETTEVLTGTITPTSATNILKFSFSVMGVWNSATTLFACLFQDPATDAIAIHCTPRGVDVQSSVTLEYEMVAGTTSATTFSIGLGNLVADTFYCNADGGGSALFGGIMQAQFSIQELKV